MTPWDDAHRRAEMRWMSMEDAEITLPARLVAEHGREHAALLRWADEAAQTLGDGGSHAFVGTGEWCDVCGNGGAYWQHAAHALLAALDAVTGGHQ